MAVHIFSFCTLKGHCVRATQFPFSN